MKILIIYPVTHKENMKMLTVIREPLGACYISSSLMAEGHKTKVLHPLGMNNDSAINLVKEFGPECVMFSAITHNFNQAVILAHRIKKEYKKVPIIFGGDHVTSCVHSYEKFPYLLSEALDCADYVVYGEGEKTAAELAACLENKKDPLGILGIAYRKNGKIIINAPRQRMSDFSFIPDRKDLPMHMYRDFGYEISRPGKIASIHTSRGCRYKCSFCSTPAAWGHVVVHRDVKNIADEIELLVNKHGIEYIDFRDEDFFSDKTKIYDLCREINKRNLRFIWSSFARVTDISLDVDDARKLLSTMKSSGYRYIFYGVESMNEAVLKSTMKRITAEHIRTAIELARELGIKVWITFMIGNPNETFEELSESLNKIQELSPDYIYFSYRTPFPGTPDYEKYVNMINSKNWDDYDCCRPMFGSSEDAGKIVDLIEKFKKSYYTSPKFIAKILDNIRDDPKELERWKNFYDYL
jgi:radical SAM superfamily enzyme YgiQ (UPF0313 family)